MTKAAMRRPPGTLTLAVLATVLVGGLVGCGLRLETPDPQPPVPDAVETVRQRTATDALTIVTLAERAAATADSEPTGTDPPADAAAELTTILAQVADDSGTHLIALGGVYEPFPGTPTPDDGTTPAPGPATAAQVVALLRETGIRARADAADLSDGPLSLVLAAVAVNRLLLAETLASAADLPEEDLVEFTVPEVAPGVGLGDLIALVQSEDAAGLAWEVHAARSTGTERDLAAARAVTHRDRAQAWAEIADVVNTGADPRRSSYTLPDELVDPETSAELRRASVAAIEGRLAGTYASLVAQAEAGERSPFIDGLWDCSRAQLRAGGWLTPLPGLSAA